MHNNQFRCKVIVFFLPQCEDYQVGDRLEVIGSIDPQSANGFFKQKSLTVQVVQPVKLKSSSVEVWPLLLWQFLWRQAWHAKSFLLEGIRPLLAGRQYALIKGMVFGGDEGLSDETQESFRVTGLTHVVSASGYNLSVIAGCALAGLGLFLPRRWLGLTVVGLIWFYGLMAELTPPIKRAAVMLTLNLLAKRVFFRQYSLEFSLALSAGLLLWWEPFLSRSLSFHLSMLATTGIIMLLPRFSSWQGQFFRHSTGDIGGQGRNEQNSRSGQGRSEQGSQSGQGKNNQSRGLRQSGFKFWAEIKESFLVTVSAQTLTLPLVAVVFNEVSWLSFVVNPVLLWLTPLITLSGLGLMSLVGLGRLLGCLVEKPDSIWWWLGAELVKLPTELFLYGVGWFGQFKSGLISW